ncbi:hypothetical protein [Nostoc sp.]|uniref:hypothetical protein n=1 Tax=Nostoc sp. TaxID=1180 RepID=UPI002FFB7CCD
MKSFERESLWMSYAHSWGGWISRWLDLEETQALSEQIPQCWIDLIANPCAVTIQKVWAKTADSLPRFIDYLTNSILEARVAESEIGYLLVYFLKDWREVDINEYENGFMMTGLPTPEEDITKFEAQIGTLPASMRTLWLTHGFVQRRDSTFIVSLQPQQQKLVHAPKFYPARRDRWQEGRVLECLGIADVVGEIVPSFSRQVGTSSWDDYIVDVMRWEETMAESLRIHIDDFLADWTFSEWH